ncbi:sulfotransferase domain-containing protein [Sulfitobacter mediterraneus]|uniref:Aryl sulfotransferase n=1 Tax=Sulfitobacter mediterraneus TaxID=83219 RepID=A0A2T6CGZ1_9RHOB|nr:sulfotransferase domain-containing protein [Sulfitobacter mediterraneus]KIN77343.1 Glycolipid sulfotransferase [Sulfitobacter mediterraneus KCTC 32188]PTX74773.1 aryl sulfotransferase [Sulfitobacter mediterraneus]
MNMAHRPPVKIYRETITDSTRWQAFEPRDGDIVLSTPPKSGTTWIQAILALLISGDPQVDAKPSQNAPWIDINVRDIAEVVERLEAQTGRRQVKSHTPFDGLPIWNALRYICVYRHPIDVHFSFRRHAANLAHSGTGVTFPDDPVESFYQFLDEDRFDAASLQMITDHYRSALALEEEEASNLLRLHYADMCRDPAAAIARIADHIGITHPPALMARLVEAASFANMKANAVRFAPGAGVGFWHDDAGFFDTASSNKWEGVLSDKDLAAYRARIAGMLSPQEQRWLEQGSALT